MQQSSFLEDPLTPLEKPEFAFEYQFTSGGHPHGPMMIHDWEVQEAHRQYKRRYNAEALDHLTRMYGQNIPARNQHLIMGTMLAHPRTFIIKASCSDLSRTPVTRGARQRASCGEPSPGGGADGSMQRAAMHAGGSG